MKILNCKQRWRDVVSVMTEEDLLARAVEERRSIVVKYKFGRQNGAKIDPWEDATLEVYGDLDRYGFRRYESMFELK